MTAENYAACLDKTLGYEGGYSDDPNDPGNWTGCAPGAGELKGTMKGISACSYPDEDIANLTDDHIAEIYRQDYWDVVKGDDLPAGLDLCTFDGGVNSGPARGLQWTQEATGAAPDGVCGPETIACCQAAEPHAAIDAACDARLAFLRTLDTWPRYGEGWTNRVEDVRRTAHSMASAAPPAPPPEPAPAPETQTVSITILIELPAGVKLNVEVAQ
jgi:lysozyme family protein